MATGRQETEGTGPLGWRAPKDRTMMGEVGLLPDSFLALGGCLEDGDEMAQGAWRGRTV